MTGKALGAAVLASFLAVTPQAWGRASAPLIPTALVEDVKSASADVEFMDYVGTGKVIKLEPGETLVLSYLRSCEHETISGGTVHIGANRSEVEGGLMPCLRSSRFPSCARATVARSSLSG